MTELDKLVLDVMSAELKTSAGRAPVRPALQPYHVLRCCRRDPGQWRMFLGFWCMTEQGTGQRPC